jgi:hypothetical protein
MRTKGRRCARALAALGWVDIVTTHPVVCVLAVVGGGRLHTKGLSQAVFFQSMVLLTKLVGTAAAGQGGLGGIRAVGVCLAVHDGEDLCAVGDELDDAVHEGCQCGAVAARACLPPNLERARDVLPS